MHFDDPSEFEEYIAPVGGDVVIRPATGSVFNAEIRMNRLKHAGLFEVSANSFKVEKEPQGEFYGLSIPLSASISVLESGRNHVYDSSSAHLLLPGHSFDCTAKRKCHFLVTNFFVDPITDYSKKMLQADSRSLQQLNSNISFLTQTGSNLLRSVAKAWSVLNNKAPASEIIMKELEDELLASFVLHTSEDMNIGNYSKHDDPRHLNRAEEFISANLDRPIARDQLAEVSGRSIRTLSRSFEKKYGIGPIAFIKQRRLDAAYLDLLSAKYDATSVMQVAFKYGFSHVGKFAIEYGKVFGESPSSSLKRQKSMI